MNILDLEVMTAAPLGNAVIMAYYWNHMPTEELLRGAALGWLYHELMFEGRW